MVGIATRAPPATSSSAKSSPAGPWYRQLSMWADVTSISRSASHTRAMSSRIRMASAVASPCRPSSISRSSEVNATAIGRESWHAGSGPAGRLRVGLEVADKGNMKERLFRAYLAGGVLLAVAYFLLPEGPGLIVWDVLALSMPVAILVGVHHFRPDRRLPWLFLAAGLGAFVVGDFVWSLPIGNVLGPSDLAYAVGYPLSRSAASSSPASASGRRCSR